MTVSRFQLNGQAVEIAHEPMPLLYLLRGFGLNSPRYGCGKEQCGACTVLVDGETRFSCTVDAASVAGSEIITVEGLGSGTELHAIQQAFLELNAGQCGYCLSGIIMVACRLLQDDRSPDRDAIKAALADNLCRCGAHNRIIKAIQRAAELMREGVSS
jgi:aerobic-type carbon monoxide dehydrogenase small subunit (CoxS/CutS family)